MHTLLLSKFFNGIRWNFIEALTYQVLYTAHYSMLFYILDITTYGTIGTLLSGLYLTVSLGNCGLEQTMAIFYNQLTESKTAFIDILTSHFIFQGILYVLIILGYVFFFTNNFPVPTIITIALLLIIESMRKTFRTLLQYAFLNSVTAHIEIISLLAYVGGIWGGYYIFHTISLELLIYWLLVTSSTSSAILAYYTYNWYITLPENHPPTKNSSLLKKSIASQRILNSLNILATHFFSTQVMVILFAFKWGVHHAAIASFIGTISQSITIILRKTFGRMSYRLLTEAKTMDPPLKQATFRAITSTSNQFIYSATLLFALCIKSLQYTVHAKQAEVVPIAYILLLLSLPLLRQACNYYEIFFIAHEQTKTIVTCNIVAIVACCSVLCLSSSPILFLSATALIHLSLYRYLRKQAAHKWQVSSDWSLKPLIVFRSILFSN